MGEREPSPRPRRVFLAVYFGILILLAVRPSVPVLFDNLFPVSSIGGWDMYQYKLDSSVEAYVRTPGEDIPIDWRKHFNHDVFASSPHPNFRRSMGEDYLDFLEENSNEVRSSFESGEDFALHLDIVLVKNEEETITHNFVREFHGSQED